MTLWFRQGNCWTPVENLTVLGFRIFASNSAMTHGMQNPFTLPVVPLELFCAVCSLLNCSVFGS